MSLKAVSILDSNAAVNSVSNSDGTLSISPTTGAVVASLAALPNGDILIGNASNIATPVAMSGDATLANTGTLTLSTVNTNVASFGSSISIPNFTVNGKGLITAAGSNVVIAPAGTLTGTTLASNVVSSSLTSAGGGSFGTAAYVNTGASGATIPILNAGNTWGALQTFGNNISLGGATLNVTSLATGNILQYNGTNWINVTTSSIGVTSITGTANEVIASGSTGAVTLSTPQAIGTASAVQFGTIIAGTGSLGTNTISRVNGSYTDLAATANNLNITGTHTLSAGTNTFKFAGAYSNPILNQGSQNQTTSLSSGGGIQGFWGAAYVSGASGTVTAASGFLSEVRNTGAGVLTNAVAFNAYNFANSGGGTLTNTIGFYAAATTAGTNNYGFYSNIASASNAWNYYANGTGANYFAGNTSIGSTTTTSQFNVGSSAQFQVNSSGLVVQYNAIATVSNGVPSEVAKVDTTGLTANVAAATLYAVPASGVGMYRISAYIILTTAASVSSTLPNVQIVYTDNDTGGSVTLNATPILGIAGIGQTGALTANTVGTTVSGVIPINAKASTNIQYQTVNYASSLAGMAYSLHLKLEIL